MAGVSGRIEIGIGLIETRRAALRAVAGRGRDEDIPPQGIGHGIFQQRVFGEAAQTEVDHLRAGIGCTADRQGDVIIVAVALTVQHLQRQEFDVGRQAGHADAVVGGRGDEAGHVCAVAVVVVRRIV